MNDDLPSSQQQKAALSAGISPESALYTLERSPSGVLVAVEQQANDVSTDALQAALQRVLDREDCTGVVELDLQLLNEIPLSLLGLLAATQQASASERQLVLYLRNLDRFPLAIRKKIAQSLEIVLLE
jgi:hypothetical protein